MSLYRIYRPLAFADVVGQDHIVTTLEQAAKQDKLSHAYLFAGSRGTGKTSVARILAKVAMTQGIEDETLKAQIIKGVEEGSIVDLLEIDGASNRGIDDIRDLIEKIQFSPVVAGAKVYIIDEVHMLTKEAFNALLKTLEEPPAYAYFILATTELNKIPSTIQSRCQCFPFRRIREDDIIRRLQYIADQERITIEREALRAIAHHVEGGMRDAISLLDQLRSLEKVTLIDVEQRIGSTGLKHIEEVFSAIAIKDANAVLKAVQKIEEAGVPFEIFIRQMLGIVRKKLHEAIEEKDETEHIIFILDTLLDAIRNVRLSPVPGLVLESALLSICNIDETKIANLLRVENEEKDDEDTKKSETLPTGKQIRSTKSEKEDVKLESKESEKTEEAKKNDENTEDTKLSDALVEAPDFTEESLRSSWFDIVKLTTPAAVKMSLKNGRIVKVNDNEVTIAFSSAFHKDTVSKTEASTSVEKILGDMFKKKIRIHCTLEEADQSSQETKKTDDVNLAEAAAEIF
ncbi:MAG: DNA polymerase III subunit gamma/tau [Candidatus Peribacteraceae bacterium]|nr:DNA polymerase III subunit gamma/tau [Candidatus Peribacteraceae bacterium]